MTELKVIYLSVKIRVCITKITRYGITKTVTRTEAVEVSGRGIKAGRVVLPIPCTCGVPSPARCPAESYPACFDVTGPRPLAAAASSPPLGHVVRTDAARSRRRWLFGRYRQLACFAPKSPQCVNCYPSRAR